MEVTIIAFGQIAEIAGKPTWTIPAVADTEALHSALKEAYPAISNINFRIAVNKKIVTENTVLGPQSIIALLPPFSGG